MAGLMKRLWQDEQGQDLAEYGIALAVIGALVVTAVIAVSDSVETLWDDASSRIQDAASQAGGGGN